MASPPPPARPIHVFIASPGDLAVERRAFKAVIDELNGGFGDGAGVRFVALGWEDTLATTGRRAQGVINEDIDRSDVFVLALHRRWGQKAPDAHPYSSYTEEEFHRAMERWTKTGSPEIFVFFKHVDPGQMADPGPQLQKVLAFRRQLEDSRQVLYRSFADEKAFTAEVDRPYGPTPRASSRGPTRRARPWYCRSSTPRRSRRPKPRRKAAEQRAEAHQKHAEAQAARADKLALELAEAGGRRGTGGPCRAGAPDFRQGP